MRLDRARRDDWNHSASEWVWLGRRPGAMGSGIFAARPAVSVGKGIGLPIRCPAPKRRGRANRPWRAGRASNERAQASTVSRAVFSIVDVMKLEAAPHLVSKRTSRFGAGAGSPPGRLPDDESLFVRIARYFGLLAWRRSIDTGLRAVRRLGLRRPRRLAVPRRPFPARSSRHEPDSNGRERCRFRRLRASVSERLRRPERGRHCRSPVRRTRYLYRDPTCVADPKYASRDGATAGSPAKSACGRCRLWTFSGNRRLAF